MQQETSSTYLAALAADDAYSDELRRLFGKCAGDVRYTIKGAGKPGSKLRRLRDAKLAADRALHAEFEATRATRDGAP